MTRRLLPIYRRCLSTVVHDTEKSCSWRHERKHSFQILVDALAAIERDQSSRKTCIAHLASAFRLLVKDVNPTIAHKDLSAALFFTSSQVGTYRIAAVLYVLKLLLHQLAPPHQTVELRFGAKTFSPVLKRLVSLSGSEDEVSIDTLLRSLPDYGAIIPIIQNQKRLLYSPSSLSMAEVHQELLAIAQETGDGSVLRKQDRALKLLQQCGTTEEMIYVVRILAHQKLRISIGDKSILVALAHAMCTPSDDNDDVIKQWENAVVRAYAQSPDYGALASLLLQIRSLPLQQRTQKLLEQAAPRVGAPVLTMAAYPVSSINEAIKRSSALCPLGVTCEYKYGGARVQLHLSLDKEKSIVEAKVYSRNMEDQTAKYHTLLDRLRECVIDDNSIHEMIVEGEVVAIDRDTGAFLPFQTLQTKTTTELGLFLFDILAINGKSLLQQPFQVRRSHLKSILHNEKPRYCQVVESIDMIWESVSNPQQYVESFLHKSVAAGCEGLMVKTLDGEYSAGTRSYTWIKLKHDYLGPSESNGTFLADTLDVVPMGAYYGKGRRAGVYGSFLIGIYNKTTQKYEAIGKVGTGFSYRQLQDFTLKLRPMTTSQCPEHCLGGKQQPDVWFSTPDQVWEIKATQLTRSPSYLAAATHLPMEKGHSAGVGVRFPRFLHSRDDKLPTQATDSAQVAQLYQDQFV